MHHVRAISHHAVQSGCSLYSQLVGRQIQCYARLGIFTVFAVTKESDGRVQHHDNGHADVEHTGTPDEMLRSFHVVFQRHYLLYTDRINKRGPLNTGRSPTQKSCMPFGGIRYLERIQFAVREFKCISCVNIDYACI